MEIKLLLWIIGSLTTILLGLIGYFLKDLIKAVRGMGVFNRKIDNLVGSSKK